MTSFLNPEKEISKHKDKLPHWQQGEVWVFATWRLTDSLPQAKLLKWKEEKEIWIKHHPQPWDVATENTYRKKFNQTINTWLDAGYGECLLNKKENATIVKDAFLFFNNDRYQLSNFVIMPNHAHVLFQPLNGYPLEKIIQSWKSFSAKAIHKLEGRTGSLWQKNYWDRLIRSQEHFDWVKDYIHKNPKNLPSGKYLLWSGDL